MSTPQIPRWNRRSVRIPGYDYRNPGAYFITICTHERQKIFGIIGNGAITLSPYGEIALRAWHDSAERRQGIRLGPFVVMPDHVHGIVWIQDPPVRPPADENDKFRSTSQSIGALVRGFKADVTTRINTMRNTPKVPIWQRNYFEHVIRNERSLERISEYIENNPRIHWERISGRRNV